MTYLPDRADDLPCVADVSRRLAVREVTGEYVPSPFDVLIEQHGGKAFQRARAEAQEMCGSCPIRDQCLVDNRHEEWVQALIGVRVRKAPTKRDICGQPEGHGAHMRAKEHACDACKAAAAAKARRLAAKYRAAAKKRKKAA